MDLLADLRYANLNCKDADAACKVADRKEREATVDYIRAIHSMQVQEKHMQSVGYRIKSGLSEKTAREGKEQIRELTEHVKQANSACESARRELTIATENAKKTKEFAVQIDSRIDQAIKELKKNGLWIYGLDMNGESEVYNTKLEGAIGIVVGNEGSGISRLVKENCDALMKIPMTGKINSLNASVSVAITIYEVVRQKNIK